ncbi:MAG: M12 family metallo-peptidase, partial [Holophagales bacterium]|nr:M12 family metallo-peptidase [Holophagales bacterium]
MNLTKSLYFFICLILCVSALPAAAQPTTFAETHAGQAFLPGARAQEALDELLADWQTFDLDLPALEREVRTIGRVTLLLGGQTFELDLEPVDLLAPGFRAVEIVEGGREVELPAPTGAYRGTLAGHPGSDVRLVITPGFLQGYVKTEDDWFFLDPVLKFDRGAPSHQIVLFREHDVRAGGESRCGSGALHGALGALTRVGDAGAVGRDVSANLLTTAFEAGLAAEADFEYQQIYGFWTGVQILGIVNQVNGFMKAEVGVELLLGYARGWNTPNDPYSSTDPDTLLFQLVAEWNGNPPVSGHDLVHLFTGKNLDGSTIGIAAVGEVCRRPEWSYGLSQTHPLLVKLVAHESGHNFGA